MVSPTRTVTTVIRVVKAFIFLRLCVERVKILWVYDGNMNVL